MRKVVPQTLIHTIIGMSEKEAINTINNKGYQSRVWMTNGKGCIVTADYRSDRLNLTIEDGKIVAAEIG